MRGGCVKGATVEGFHQHHRIIVNAQKEAEYRNKDAFLS